MGSEDTFPDSIIYRYQEGIFRMQSSPQEYVVSVASAGAKTYHFSCDARCVQHHYYFKLFATHLTWSMVLKCNKFKDFAIFLYRRFVTSKIISTHFCYEKYVRTTSKYPTCDLLLLDWYSLCLKIADYTEVPRALRGTSIYTQKAYWGRPAGKSAFLYFFSLTLHNMKIDILPKKCVDKRKILLISLPLNLSIYFNWFVGNSLRINLKLVSFYIVLILIG